MGRLSDFFSGQLAVRALGEPLEGTNMSLYQSIIPNWWAENINGNFPVGGAALADSVWVANICKHMNAQQISAMPIEFHGSTEPAWMASPDPNLFPSGIGDAIFAIVDQLYGWGFSCQYVTDFYSDGFPRSWTVLPSGAVNIRWKNGSRAYKLGEAELDPSRVIQVDRNPGTGLHGSSAMAAFSQPAWGLLAAQNQSMTVSQGGIPKFYLKSERKLTKEQAEALQLQWAAATQNRSGMPPVVPPEIVPTEMSFDPASMALLETQEWDARVLANAFGVPSVLLNMALQGGLTYQNPMALMQMWWLKELRTTAKRIAESLSSPKMLPRGQWVSFDASDITTELNADSADDDEQAAKVANASPPQQTPKLAAIGGNG